MALELNRKLNGEATFYTASINNSTSLIHADYFTYPLIHTQNKRCSDNGGSTVLQIYGIHSQVHSRGVGSRGAGG